jgi:hypothetical protein
VLENNKYINKKTGANWTLKTNYSTKKDAKYIIPITEFSSENFGKINNSVTSFIDIELSILNKINLNILKEDNILEVKKLPLFDAPEFAEENKKAEQRKYDGTLGLADQFYQLGKPFPKGDDLQISILEKIRLQLKGLKDASKK